MIERSMERRALLREVINLPALLSFDGISGVHPCVVHDINAFGARLSTPHYMFASDFELSFNGFRTTFACRVAWRRATLCGVVFVMRPRRTEIGGRKGRACKHHSAKSADALSPVRSVKLDACLKK